MGRQAYRNRLALGRSPYEAPDPPTGPTAHPAGTTQRTSALHADGYVQHYSERGHPVNPQSKSFGRELRKAKNDILSTMGIVVSEDGNAGALTEQQKVDMIAAENDYGLVMATLDQISVFLGSWWTTSLTGRIQAFKSYTHEPLMQIFSRERASVGVVGFYFAGIPSWAISTCLSICRHHPLERLIASIQNYFPGDDVWSKIVRSSFTLLHSATRGTLLVMAIQTYMYSLLQSLHLVHPYALPGLQFLIPFGETVSAQLPSPPTDLSLGSLSTFALGLVKAPPFLVYLYVYLRPFIEIRLYRLFRRRLPKPTLADELSIKVAFENDLIDWMVPTLGRRSEEENRRNDLTLAEDIMCEVGFLRYWVLSWFGIRSQPGLRASEQAASARQRELPESLPVNIEHLEQQSRAYQPPQEEQEQPSSQQQDQEHAATHPDPPHPPAPARTPDSGVDFGENRVLAQEENRISQSPAEMSSRDFSEMPPLGRTRASASTAGPSSSYLEPAESQAGGDNNTSESRRNSRSNTLFSRPSSPETSSPTSPRVRASLIHQNSDVITMQLELLGSRGTPNHGQLNPRTGNEVEQPQPGSPADRRSISEFLDSLLSNQGQQNLNTTTNSNSDAIDSDGLSNISPGVPAGAEETTTPVPPPRPPPYEAHQQQPLNPEPAPPHHEPPPQPGALIPSPPNILPDSVEEPDHDHDENRTEPEPLHQQTFENDLDDSEILPRALDPDFREVPTNTSTSTGAHRVTILSSHPVDSLASHLASITTTILFLPLESLYLRSLAASYLSSSSTPASGISASDVRGLGLFGGSSSRSDMLIYMGKMALMIGVQGAVNASVWGVISGAAIKIGKKFCGWGTL